MRLSILNIQGHQVKDIVINKKLFINTSQQSCGVYQYGLRLFNILNKDNGYDYIECSTLEKFLDIEFNKYIVCIYNYHPGISGSWLDYTYFTKIPNLIYIYHDIPIDNVSISKMLDTTPANDRGVPRPLYTDNAISRIQHTEHNKPVIGSFGYASHRKNFDKIISLVHRDFPDGAHVRIQTTKAYYDYHQPNDIYTRCMSEMKNANISLEFITDTYSEEQIFNFLCSNDLNVFLYDEAPGAGCASVLDFAISSNRPIAISDSNMFRHVYSDSICAYKRSLKDIMNDGTEYISQFQDKWSHDNLRNRVDQLINTV
jgi:hypothetical protein